MKLTFKSWAFFVLTLLVSPMVANADGFGVCNNCTPVQMQEKAAGISTNNSLVHVLDLVQGAYRTYFVEVISEPGFSKTLVQEVGTAPETAQILQNTLDLAAFLAQDKEIRFSELPLGDTGINSAVDVAGNYSSTGGIEYAVGQWLATNGSSDGVIVIQGTVLSHMLNQSSGMDVTVTFDDGTSIQLEVTKVTVDENGNPVVRTKVLSFHRQNGELIPTSVSGLSGISEAISNQAELDDWLNLARRLGIPIVEGAGQAPGGVPLPARFECWIEGTQVKCRLVYDTQ